MQCDLKKRKRRRGVPTLLTESSNKSDWSNASSGTQREFSYSVSLLYSCPTTTDLARGGRAGQAESGKSTVLKNFQLHFAPEAFHAESEAWRAVIHLNLIRSVNFILDLLPGGPTSQHESSSRHSRQLSENALVDDSLLRHFRMRLSPLRQVELILVQRLSADDPSRAAVNVEEAMPWYYGRASEVSIRGGTGWKALLRRKWNASQVVSRPDELDKARQILHACRQDIAELWGHSDVQQGLEAEGVVLRDQSGLCVLFFARSELFADQDAASLTKLSVLRPLTTSPPLVRPLTVNSPSR